MILQNPPDKATTTHDLFDVSMFEIDKEKGMINLTKIAKAFEKRLDVWLKSQSTQEFINAMDDLTLNGGSCLTSENGKGTWATRDVAIEFAQWINPKFKVFCIKKLDELFQTGKTQLAPPKEMSRKELAEWILEAENEKERLQLEVQTLAPKAESYERLMSSDELLTMEETAKVLSQQKGKTIGRNRLFAFLKRLNVLKSDNVPYQSYIDRGYFKLIVSTWTDPENNKEHINFKTNCTTRGLEWLSKMSIV